MGNSHNFRAIFGCFGLGLVALTSASPGILSKPNFAGGDDDGAARGKIVNGFEKRPTAQFRAAFGSELDSDEDALKADIEALMTQAKFEAVVIAERNFARQMDSCFENTFCELAAAKTATVSEGNDLDVDASKTGTAVEYTIEMLRAMLDEIGPSSHHQFPSVRRIVAAYTVGAGVAEGASGDICQWLFPCIQSETEGRSPCSVTSKICPGIAIGCGLCAIMQIDSCPFICPISAVYCGSSGYVCAGASKSD